MLRDVALLVLGGGLLYFGAEWLVRGAAGLAAKLHVRPLVIGLTIVAYGTSMPELVVSVGAGLTDRGAIAFGNVIGSNIANIGLILGLTALVAPPKVDPSLRRRELPVLLLSTLVVPLLLIDGTISRAEGAGLVVGALAHTYVMIRRSRVAAEAGGVAGAARADGAPPAVEIQAEEIAEVAREAAGAPPTDSRARLIVIAMTGLGCLLLGGHWFVEGAAALAAAFGVSDRVVGLTIVAVGTSLPELATSLVAARRGHPDLAIGNVVGSNIFNALLILGAAALARPLAVSLRQSRLELGALLIATLLATGLLRGRRLGRGAGGGLLAFYVLFVIGLAGPFAGR